MNYKKYIIFVFLFLIVAAVLWFTSYAQPHEIGHTHFIQGSLDNPALVEIKDKLTPTINTIIKEELGLAPGYDFNFFIPKKWQRLTMYSLSDIPSQDALDLVMQSAEEVVHKNQPTLALKAVNILPDLHFFGDNKDELVIMIEDPNKELSFLNQELTSALHALNQTYQTKHNAPLYNVEKSERFAYVPHVGLGRIRAQSITEHVQDKSEIDAVLNRIRERILQEAITVVKEELDPESANVSFKNITIFELPSRIFIKEYPIT